MSDTACLSYDPQMPAGFTDWEDLRPWELADFWNRRDTHIDQVMRHAGILCRSEADKVAAHVAAAAALVKAADLVGPMTTPGSLFRLQASWMLFRARCIADAAPLDQIA